MLIQQVTTAGVTELGEGPHWDSKTQSLYYVDIFMKTINRYIPATESLHRIQLDKMPSLVIPRDGTEDRFIVTQGRNVVEIQWDGEGSDYQIIRTLAEVDAEDSVNNNRINDGKCDPTGRLWFGTMGHEPIHGQISPNKGSLFQMNSVGNVTKHVTGIWISNGLTWNSDRTKFYYIDSMKYAIDEYDYENDSGKIGKGKSIFNFATHKIEGLPDGMTIDTDGNLWVAVFNGSQILKVDPRTPDTLLLTIKLPSKQVTSVAWGGSNFDELYVTTGKFTIDGIILDEKDGHGGLFRITGLGVRGLPMTNCKI